MASNILEASKNILKARLPNPQRLGQVLLLINGIFRLIPFMSNYLHFGSIEPIDPGLMFTGILMLAASLTLIALHSQNSDLVAGFLLSFSIVFHPVPLVSVLSVLILGTAISFAESSHPSISSKEVTDH
jgi:hypothetical protein